MPDTNLDVLYVVGGSRDTDAPPAAVRQLLGEQRTDVSLHVRALDALSEMDLSGYDVLVFDVATATDWERGRAFLQEHEPPPHAVVYGDFEVVDSTEAIASEAVNALVPRGTRSSVDVLEATLVRVVGADSVGDLTPESGSHLQAVMDVTSDAVVTIDESSTIRFVNQAIEDQLGYEPEELIGKSLTKLMPQPLIQRHLAGFAEYLQTGEQTLDWDYVELTGQHADGYTVPLGISFSEFRKGDDRYFTGILRDISDRSDLEETRQHEQRVLEQVVETMPAGLVIINEDREILRMNSRAAEIAGVTRETIESENISFDFYDENGDPIPDDEHVATRVLDEGETLYDHVLQFRRPDGERRWISVNGSRFREADGEQMLRGIFTIEDLTDARTRAERLRRLTNSIRELPEFESKSSLSEALVHTVLETMTARDVAVALYEAEDGALRTTASQYADEELGEVTYTSGSEVWETFIKNENRTIAWEETTSGPTPEGDEGEAGGVPPAIAASMGKHGILLVRPIDVDEDVDSVRDYIEMIAATARSAFNRVDREEDIRMQRDLLQEKTGRLERVEQVNHAIRRITQVLMQAESQEEIEQLVCEELANAEPYSLVWYGHHNAETNELEPTAVAGRDQGYLDRVRVAVDVPSGEAGPAGTALRTGDVSVQNSILEESGDGSWRDAALERGFQSVATVPVQFRGTDYGALNLYAEQPGQFERLEQAVLEEMSETIGFAMRSLERKRAFVSEQSVELEVRVPDVEDGLFGFLPADHGEVTVENMVLQMNGSLHLFFRMQGIEEDELRERAYDSDAVRSFTRITDEDTASLFECSLGNESVISRIMERGARFENLTIGAGELRARIRIPQSAEAREYMDVLQDGFGSVELVAKRQREESVMTAQEFEEDVRNMLTARQEEVIQTAYYSGYFKWPRESTGGEVAEILGVTQPTVNRHIRTGEQALFGLLYDGPEEEDEPSNPSSAAAKDGSGEGESGKADSPWRPDEDSGS